MKTIPLVLLSGFLGAGKTTLLAQLLKAAKARQTKLAVVENEYAVEFGLESELLQHTTGAEEAGEGEREGEEEGDGKQREALVSNAQWQDVVEFGNGCICCSSSGSFLRAMAALVENEFDLIVLETTGRADPGPIVQLLHRDPYLNSRVHVELIVTVVDCLYFQTSIVHKADMWKNEALEQLRFADLVILNKEDLVSKETVEALRKQCLQINPFQPEIVATSYARIDVDALLQRCLSPHAPAISEREDVRSQLEAAKFLPHDPSVQPLSIFFELEAGDRFDVDRLKKALVDAAAAMEILRLKALFVLDPERMLIVQGVRKRFDFSVVRKSPDSHPVSRVAIIGSGIAGHQKDIEDSVRSCLLPAAAA